jgi:hypothetical protein
MDNVKERVDDILHKPMSRQQFLKQAGLLALAVVGVTSVINTLDPKRSAKPGEITGSAYGASVYAGGKKPV